MHIEIKVHATKEGKYIVKCPTIPGCQTEGESMDEALDKLAELISKSISRKVKTDLKKVFKNFPKNPPAKGVKGLPATNNLIFSNFPVSLN